MHSPASSITTTPRASDSMAAGLPPAPGTNTTTTNTTSGSGFSTKQHKVRPRLRAEGVMAPPASDAATLRRQVAALQSDVEAHIEAEQRLQTLNHQLSERLEVYMKQNHENLERAANEMNTLHEDMQQTLDLQRRLSKKSSLLESEKKELEHEVMSRKQIFDTERSSLEMHISSLTDELIERSNTDAEAISIQLEFDKTLSVNSRLQELILKNDSEAIALRQRSEECKRRLQSLLAEEKLGEEAQRHHTAALLRRSFARFLEGLCLSRYTRKQEHAADQIYQHLCCKKGFFALHLATQRSRKIRLASKSHHHSIILKEVWKEWHFMASARKKCSKARRQQIQTLSSKAFVGWKNVLCSNNGNGMYQDLAAKHWRGYLLKRALSNWTQWVVNVSKPKKAKVQQAVVHLGKATLRLSLVAWKHVLQQTRQKKMTIEQGIAHWKRASMRVACINWKRCLKLKRLKKMLYKKAGGFRREYSWRLVFKLWQKYLVARSCRTASKDKAADFYDHWLKRKKLRVWKQNILFQRVEAKALRGFHLALLRSTLGYWQDYHAFQLMKLQRERKAIVHRRRIDQKLLRKVLLIWWEEMVWTRHATEMQHLLASWWRRFLLRAAFHTWIHGTFQNVLLTSSQYHSGLQEAKEKCDKQRHRTTAVDVENLHLIDRLHLMSSEIAFLMLTINEKTGRRQELQHALEDAAVVESSMRCDLEQQRLRIDELENEALTLQRSLQKKNSEDVAGEVYHALRIQSLEQSLKDVQTQLSNKLSQVEFYERALKDTADRLEGTSDESHQKLSSAFQIAASLRLLLEERENQCAALEGSCRRRDLELDEVMKKLSMNNSSYVETLEARDSRINELERLLVQKQAQIEEVHHDVQDVQQAISSRDGCYRKLEYEMRLLSSGVEDDPWRALKRSTDAVQQHFTAAIVPLSTDRSIIDPYIQTESSKKYGN